MGYDGYAVALDAARALRALASTGQLGQAIGRQPIGAGCFRFTGWCKSTDDLVE
jgi:hypothetical protein